MFIRVLPYWFVSHLKFIIGVSLSICMFSYLLCTEYSLTEWDSPTGGVAAALLVFFLNLNPLQERSLKQHLNEFDFLGLFLIVSGVAILLVGFNQSETSCEDLWSGNCAHLCLTVISRVFSIHHFTLSSWICGSFCWSSKWGIHQTLTNYPSTSLLGKFYSYILVLRVSWFFMWLDPNHGHYFDHKSCAWIYFFHDSILSSSLFSSPWSLRNQVWRRVSVVLDVTVDGSDWSFLRFLPFSLGGSALAAISGVVVSKTGLYRPVIWFGCCSLTTGTGLMVMLDAKSSV